MSNPVRPKLGEMKDLFLKLFKKIVDADKATIYNALYTNMIETIDRRFKENIWLIGKSFKQILTANYINLVSLFWHPNILWYYYNINASLSGPFNNKSM